jgi:hypothetical protein
MNDAQSNTNIQNKKSSTTSTSNTAPKKTKKTKKNKKTKKTKKTKKRIKHPAFWRKNLVDVDVDVSDPNFGWPWPCYVEFDGVFIGLATFDSEWVEREIGVTKSCELPLDKINIPFCVLNRVTTVLSESKIPDDEERSTLTIADKTYECCDPHSLLYFCGDTLSLSFRWITYEDEKGRHIQRAVVNMHII